MSRWKRSLGVAAACALCLVPPVVLAQTGPATPYPILFVTQVPIAVDFADAEDQRLLRVTPNLVVRHTGHTITATVAAKLSHPTVWLFRYTPSAQMVWSGVRPTTANSSGVATFKRVPAGRYYVAVLGGTLYLDNGSEPFNIPR